MKTSLSGQNLTRSAQQLYLREDLQGVISVPCLRELEAVDDTQYGCTVRRRYAPFLQREWQNEVRPPGFCGFEYGPLDAPTLGLEPVLRYLLAELGYREPLFPPRDVGPFQPVALDDGMPTNTELLRFVAEHDRGRVFYDPRHIDVGRCSAEICCAVSDARIAIVVSTKRQRREITAALRQCGVAVTEIRLNHGERPVERVCVTLPNGLAEFGVENAHLRLVVCIDANAAAGEQCQLALNSCERARLFAFSPLGFQVAPRNRDRVAATFGFEFVTLVAPGLTTRPVRVAWLEQKYAGRVPRGSSPDLMSILPNGIWRNPSRGRRLMRLARQISEPQGGEVRRNGFGSHIENPLRTVVMTGVREHAEYLRRQEPSLQLFTAPPTFFGCGRTLDLAPGNRCLLTTAHDAHGVDWSSVDALIWAGSGEEGPQLTEEMLAASADTLRPLMLVDVQDTGHPLLGAMSRRRRRRYREQDWCGVHEDPVAARVRRFLCEPHRRIPR